MKASYQRSQALNAHIRTLLKKYNLPTHNRYAFSKAFLKKAFQLQQDESYLVLLSLFWAPIDHLLGTARSVVDDFEESSALLPALERYEELEPECHHKLLTYLQDFKAFNLDIHPDSLNLPLRLSDYRELLLQQKQFHAQYNAWHTIYTKSLPHMQADLLALHQSDSAAPGDPQLLLDLLLIFREYVKNLMVDPKNRTKYNIVDKNVAAYIKFLKSELKNDSTDIDDTSPTINYIGSVFTQILRNATDYPALAPIGPAYICWLFKNRIFKIGNPLKEDINLCLVNSKKEELFRLNTDWHESPSIPDQAQIYLFDELFALWEKHNLGSTALSRYLFERSTPYYRDFIKADFKMTPEKPHLTHHYVSYDPSYFSNDFLQRALSCINLTFSPKCFFPETRIDEAEWKQFLSSPLHDDHGFSLLKNHFVQTKEMVELASQKRRTPAKVNIEDLFHFLYSLLKEPYIKSFEQIFLLDPHGCGCNTMHIPWMKRVNDYFDDIFHEIEDQFKWKISPAELKEEFESTIRNEYGAFAVDAVILICSKSLRDSYLAQIMTFSKQAFFKSYSDEQYAYLDQFLSSNFLANKLPT